MQAIELAKSHFRQRRLDQAERFCREALAGDGANAEMLNLLGMICSIQGRFEEATQAFEKAITARPDFVEALNNLGAALRNQSRLPQAASAYERALAIRPDFVAARYNLANLLAAVQRLDDAEAEYHQVIAQRPNFAEAHSNLGALLKETGRLDDAVVCQRTAERLKPDPSIGSALLSTLLYHPNFSPKEVFDEHLRWSRQYAEPLKKEMRPHQNRRDSERLLRIGYVSPDFRSHAVGLFLLPILMDRDAAQFEVFCYSNVLYPDSITSRFRSNCDGWREITRLDDARAAEMIRADRIDILIDLALHSANNRLLIFARKPAPVQATFAGYPGTTGLSTIDYRISDVHLDTPGSTPAIYSENTLRLPSFWCFPSTDGAPAVSELPALANGFITFGCLNNFCKVNDLTLDHWANVLMRLPSSRLLLRAPAGASRARVMARLEKLGVGRERIEFVGRQNWVNYMETYQRIDLALDTFPYNGHTTTLDSLWMGAPPITLAGSTAIARGGRSMLSNVGVDQFVCTDAKEMAERAVELTADLKGVANLRRELRARMRDSCLTDFRRFARDLEGLYRDMWRTWCESNR